MKIICKCKFKSKCAEAQNVQSRKTRTKKQSTAESVTCLGKGYQIQPSNFQKLWSIQKWKINHLITILILIICCCVTNHPKFSSLRQQQPFYQVSGGQGFGRALAGWFLVSWSCSQIVRCSPYEARPGCLPAWRLHSTQAAHRMVTGISCQCPSGQEGGCITFPDLAPEATSLSSVGYGWGTNPLRFN